MTSRFTALTTAVVVPSKEWAMLAQLGDDRTAGFTLDRWSTSRTFGFQGIDHIRAGFDHTLVLVALTLGVVRATVTRRPYGASSHW